MLGDVQEAYDARGLADLPKCSSWPKWDWCKGILPAQLTGVAGVALLCQLDLPNPLRSEGRHQVWWLLSPGQPSAWSRSAMEFASSLIVPLEAAVYLVLPIHGEVVTSR